MGEGGPRPAQGTPWREQPVQFDRRGALDTMEPRWQSDMYGSRNPVAMLLGTERLGPVRRRRRGCRSICAGPDRGVFVPWKPTPGDAQPQNERNQQQALGKGLPPVNEIVPGLFDVFVFDAHDPAHALKDFSVITGPASMPPKWALGYMQSHRTLEDETQLLGIIDTFRAKQIPARRGDLPRHRLQPARLEHEAAVVRLQSRRLQARSEGRARRHARPPRQGRRAHGPVGSRQAADAARLDSAAAGRARSTRRTSRPTGGSISAWSTPASTRSGPTRATGSTSSSGSSAISSITRARCRRSRTFGRGACSATAIRASRSGAAGCGRAIPNRRGKRSRRRSPSA